MVKKTFALAGLAALAVGTLYAVYLLSVFVPFALEKDGDIEGWLEGRYGAEFEPAGKEAEPFRHRYLFRTEDGTGFEAVSRLTGLRLPYSEFRWLFMEERTDTLEESLVRSVPGSDLAVDITGRSPEEAAGLVGERYSAVLEAFERNGIRDAHPKIEVRIRKGQEERTVGFAGEGPETLAYIIGTAF